MVASSAQRFQEVLKADNPVRGEAAFALALARMFQLMPFQVTAFSIQHSPLVLADLHNGRF